MKRFWLGISLFLGFIAVAEAQSKVGIFDFDDRLDQPDSLAKHIETDLRAQVPGVQVLQFTGKGDLTTAAQVLGAMENRHLNLIILITSDAVILAEHILAKTPALFANINNPLGMGFHSLGPPGGNFSGTSYYIPAALKFNLFRTLFPKMTKAGMIFDDSDHSRYLELSESRTTCLTMGIGFEAALIRTKGELPAAVEKLQKEGADFIVLGTSSLLYENVASILPFCMAHKLPVFSFHTAGVKDGAVAALGVDFKDLADSELMPMVREVLRGRSPGTLAIQESSHPQLYLNLRTARDFGLKVPDELVDRAAFLVR